MELLKFCDITCSSSWKNWALKNHPDHGGDHNKYIMVQTAYEKYIKDKDKIPKPQEQTQPDEPKTSAEFESYISSVWKEMVAPKPGQCEAFVEKGLMFIDRKVHSKASNKWFLFYAQGKLV